MWPSFEQIDAFSMDLSAPRTYVLQWLSCNSFFTYPQVEGIRRNSKSLALQGKTRSGWGERIRTFDWLIQNCPSYRFPPWMPYSISLALADTAKPKFWNG